MTEAAHTTSSNAPRQPRHVTIANSVGFGIGDFYGGGQTTLTATYLSLFWTRFCGLDIQTAQGIIGGCTVLGAFLALFFGTLSDNLYRYPVGRRFGRRRLLMLIMAPSLLVGVFLWIPGLPAAVYCLIYVAWIALFQIFMTAYNALPGEMTTDFRGRTLLSTTRLYISNGSSTLIPLIGSAILSARGEDHPSSYQLFTISFTIMFALAMFVCWKTTWEMSPEEAGFGAWVGVPHEHRRIGFTGWMRRAGIVAHDYASTLRIRAFRQHLGIYLLLMCAMDVFGQTFAYFVIFDWGQSAAFASLLLTMTVLALPLMPVCNWLLLNFGPRRVYAIGFTGIGTGAVMMIAAWLLRVTGVLTGTAWMVFTVAGTVVFFAFRTSAGFMPWQLFPLIADVDQIVTERSRSATFAGVQAFFRQLCSGVVAMGVGGVLALTGFDATRDAQPMSAQIGLACSTGGIYLLAVTIGWVISRRLRLDRATDLELLRETDRLRGGGAKRDVDPHTRRTVEELTGVKYEDVWPDAKA
ncbi:MFS transporter [Bifidobacterium vespertilionis]|uniref:Sodium:galactoside symporter n=1 Tax=Bifidobacterium vespertilionis TaxID=2562524 RepID=A0A5J5DXE8_9BIFI|nr:MFS transporter [Bifidobacterium vespertilionis]KAA8816182.1 sodium:galactoside symporter [Bifidobacterium vespertilionis]KAA8821516.1 sodium:galactoside symporter [Bifidobacterium vespertilionis]